MLHKQTSTIWNHPIHLQSIHEIIYPPHTHVQQKPNELEVREDDDRVLTTMRIEADPDELIKKNKCSGHGVRPKAARLKKQQKTHLKTYREWGRKQHHGDDNIYGGEQQIIQCADATALYSTSNAICIGKLLGLPEAWDSKSYLNNKNKHL